jgi:hypothetical protein
LAALFRYWFAAELKETLQQGNGKGQPIAARIGMKPTAAQGQGAWLGMEPRYDNKTIGLNPLRYWSREVYRSYQPRKD